MHSGGERLWISSGGVNQYGVPKCWLSHLEKASDPPNNWIQVSEDLATEISIAAMKEAGILLD